MRPAARLLTFLLRVPLFLLRSLTLRARSLLKLAIHSASSAPTINVKKVRCCCSVGLHHKSRAIKVHGLIRKEFERNRNESRPAVVEVTVVSS